MYFQRHVRPTPYRLLDKSPTFYIIFDCFVSLCCILMQIIITLCVVPTLAVMSHPINACTCAEEPNTAQDTYPKMRANEYILCV